MGGKNSSLVMKLCFFSSPAPFLFLNAKEVAIKTKKINKVLINRMCSRFSS